MSFIWYIQLPVSSLLRLSLHPSGFVTTAQLKLFCLDSVSHDQRMRMKGFAPREQSIQTQERTTECDLGGKEVAILRLTMLQQKKESYCVTYLGEILLPTAVSIILIRAGELVKFLVQ